MRLETTTTRTSRFGLVAIAALAFSVGLALGNKSPAWAQNDDAAQNGASDSDQDAQAAAEAVQQAHDAADAAEEAVQSAIETRNGLESEGAPQDQIDEANEAISQARAAKEAADEAAQRTDEGQ